MRKNIGKEKWEKNWSGNWRMPFASLYHLYTTSLKPYVPVNLKTNLLVCEPEVSSNYILKKHLDAYCQVLVREVIKNPKVAQKWAKDTVVTAKKLIDLLERVKAKKQFSFQNLSELKGLFYLHIPPHFSMKKVIDYLPERLRERVKPGLVKARLKTENLFNLVDEVLNSYSNLVAKSAKFPKELAQFLTIEEIQIFLEKNKIPSKRILIERSQGTAIFCKGKKTTVITGARFTKLIEGLAGKKNLSLKGSIGYPGKATGRAKLVFDPKKSQDFKLGDILVTGMTRPEFLPLMKKAGAFVTDAGGLLSHAAIVARELKKPCVLGTGSATRVFKDGDLLEVDANKGIVRKI
jgi:phosphohistidine swiveling domain-containing protein